jgi:hypothetical protein
MADEHAITWDDLKTYCGERQKNCRELREQRDETHKLTIEAERRRGMADFETALKLLAEEVKGLKRTLDGAWILPKPVFVLVCIGMIGVGVAGEKIITLVLKHFGG